MSDPILKYPDPNKRYVMFTDASDQAAAGVYVKNILTQMVKPLNTQLHIYLPIYRHTFKWSTIVKKARPFTTV